MDKGLRGFVGRDVREVVARLGYPDSEQLLLGDKVYTWNNESAGSMVFPAPTAGTPATVVPYANSCTVKIIADSSGTIKDYDFYGNYGGCERYARAVSP
ncbi:MAG: hypothetical protein ABL962_08235 [Fimbriimonadaceae bacterium]